MEERRAKIWRDMLSLRRAEAAAREQLIICGLVGCSAVDRRRRFVRRRVMYDMSSAKMESNNIEDWHENGVDAVVETRVFPHVIFPPWIRDA